MFLCFCFVFFCFNSFYTLMVSFKILLRISPVFKKKKKSHMIFFINIVKVQSLHGLDQCLDGCEYVMEHKPSKIHFFSFTVFAAIDDPHLFDESALPALTSPCINTRETRPKANQQLFSVCPFFISNNTFSKLFSFFGFFFRSYNSLLL